MIDAETSRPLRGAFVLAVRQRLPDGTAVAERQDTLPPAATRTDADGRFALGELAPGEYAVVVRRSGYVQQQLGQASPSTPARQLVVGPGAVAGPLEFSLVRSAVISGRVLDASGQPADRVTVRAEQLRSVEGVSRLQAGAQATTNDLGEFRVFGLAPGSYVVSAIPPRASAPRATFAVTAEHELVPTFAPSVTALHEARAIRVGPGDEAEAHVHLVETTVATVAGRVVDSGGRPATDGFVLLQPRDGWRVTQGASTPVNPDGTFTIHGVAPGAYTVTMTPPIGSGTPGERAAQLARREVGMLDVDVSGDVSDLILRTQPGTTVRGRLVVHVQRQGFYGGPGASQSQRQVTLRGGGTTDLGDVRLLTGGVLTGRVLDHHGEPVVGGMVTALGRPSGQDVLVPLGGTADTDDRGVYRAHGLRPATYTVRVVPPGPSGRGAVRLQGSEPETLPAFATSASELSAAEFVPVRASEEAILDVRLGAGRLSRVVGQVVVQGEAATSTQLSVSLRPIDSGVQFAMASARPQPDGSFEFLDVAPGRYRVVAEELTGVTPQGQNRRRAGWAEMAVAGEPVFEVAVPIGFGAVVRGRVEVEGGDVTTLHDRPLEVVTSSVASRHFLQSGSVASSTISDLAFTLRDVLGHQQLDVQGLPAGWWLKSVLIDGEDVFDGHDFPVSGTVDGVVLLVASRPSGVQGRVAGSGDALRGSSVIVLPGESVEIPRRQSSAGRIASVTADGSFTAGALRPGRYRLVALSPMARSAYDQLGHDEQRALMTAQGRVVDVVEGRLVTVALQLVER